MGDANESQFSPNTFHLLGIPGLEHMHVWIGIPFCSMYLVAVVGNVTILAVVRAERSLHEPMFLFLCMLSITDLVLSTSTLPRMLCLFWLGAHAIALDACLAQMFFIHSFTAMESGFFLAMAIDRYVAICDPLRHATILPHSRIAKMGAAVVFRGVAFFSPHPILLKQLPYCGRRILAHTYCEFMAVVKLACVDTGATKRYSLSVASVIGSCDGFFIALSYVLILRAVFRLPSREASLKALGTCGSHVCVIAVFYSTAVFTFLTHRFGHNVVPRIHIFIANMYLLVPPFLNPIVYGIRTKKIRDYVIRCLRVKLA
ncbi:olfactory receptor 52D1-like [Perognathus longimembris pacificus]|uniref:olfactory receptor 52D1-like n=1 Tax=Perognathus longimembris pacificus TaxID=214514 RepID=UPI00201A1C76|nr:olfactory receptor 52D1-like [Perognathus longimembris pacificus]